VHPARTAGGGTIRRLATWAIAGQLAWLTAVAVAGAVEPGYSELRDAVGFLGARNAAHPWVFWVAVTISGLSHLALAAALVLDGPPGLRGVLGPALIAFTGITAVLNGFVFPVDCRSSIDLTCNAREAAGQVGWQHLAHEAAFILGGAAVQLSAFAMAWRFRGDRRWGPADRLALGAGLIGLLVIALPFTLVGANPHDLYGLAQRLTLAAGAFWILALAVGLLVVDAAGSTGRRPGSPRDRSAPPPPPRGRDAAGAGP
jgi:hypothetical protein